MIMIVVIRGIYSDCDSCYLRYFMPVIMIVVI